MLLSVRDVGYSVRNGSDTADLLHRVSLALEAGEFLGLIGPNGAGKSTLLKLVIGYLTPTVGEIFVRGAPVHDIKNRERARLVSYMGQDGPALFPYTVLQMIEMGTYPALGLGRRPGKEEHQSALDALRYVGLSHLAERSFPTLSGGEKQLALFARMLVQNTELLVLDEPTAALDLGHESRLLAMTAELCTEGRGAVAALHNLNNAAEHCDRLMLLDRGEVVAEGAPSEVLEETRLGEVYRSEVRVGKNETTGSITVTPISRRAQKSRGRVHIIGGAGSAVTLTRYLYREGWSITGGIAHELDSDTQLWKSLGIDYVEIPAFAEITENDISEARSLMEEADGVILCSFPIGTGNFGNLELAKHAETLLVLDEKSGPCPREFFAPASGQTFRELLGGREPLSFEELETRLERLRLEPLEIDTGESHG